MNQGILQLIRQRMRAHFAADEFIHNTDLPEASVLIAILDKDEPELVLTKRSAALKHHAGEIAFPGGKAEEGESEIEAALREVEEEIGISKDAVDVLGRLSPAVSLYGYKVTPVVGIISGSATFQPEPEEIEEIFTVPLRLLTSQKWLDYDLIDVDGDYFEMPFFEHEGHRIWGLTGILLTDFINQVFRAEHFLEVPHYHQEGLARLKKAVD